MVVYGLIRTPARREIELTESKAKINAAIKACDRVHTAWSEASGALSGSVAINGYGIIQDPSDLRSKLVSAQASIRTALSELSVIQWPTDKDYADADKT